MMNEFVAVVLLLLMVRHINANEIECEKKKNYDYGWARVESAKTCLMLAVTLIGYRGFEISPRDDLIGGLQMQGNKKIHYLPEKVAETFPNLLIYYAQGCSLKEVSKVNFENLIKLRMLILNWNRIEMICSDTFEDLKSLEHLELCEEVFFSFQQGFS